ncbi:MAG: TIR domain-containing protein [Gammaproteobacteria bacterium]|nr:TIR domain-containing protein [Gammaproteobacteria bacterium]
MGAESAGPASTPTRAVFLSYASQDAEAASRICHALRADGIEVWLDQSELRGGEAWDRLIRERIHDCRLFIALISAHTESRDEGYFRREWKLAVDRTHDMLEKKAFLLPVAIDATSERGAAVPDKFHEVQWTRLPGGEAPPEFVARIKRLLSLESPAIVQSPAVVASGSSPIPLTTSRPSPLRRALPVAVAVPLVAVLAYLLINKPWTTKAVAPPSAANATSSPAASVDFAPPPHSIAVLPFVNLSGDKEQEYFSDGLTEELLNSLSRMNELQVAGRTSSFYFKGKDVDLGTVAHRLNVATVLEGSVRRSAKTVRITAQLINASTGFHLWSQTYDRNLGDILALQTDIANSVAGALKVTLLGDVAAKIELGGTRSPAALDAYLRATNLHFAIHNEAEEPAAIAAYSEAIRLDPNFSLAFAGRSIALCNYASLATGITNQVRRDARDKAQADAHRAIALTPELAEAHLALATLFEASLDFAQEAKAFERALALAPGNAHVLRNYGYFAVNIGWTDSGLAALRRALALDPLNHDVFGKLGGALATLRRFDESTAVYRELLKIDPENSDAYIAIGMNYYMLRDFHSALSWCKAKPDEFSSVCLAMAYDKLRRHADAEAALAEFTASSGDIFPYVVAMTYAQWGNSAEALDWLEKAVRLPDLNIEALKVDPLLDPVRKEPRFRAILRGLKFPSS